MRRIIVAVTVYALAVAGLAGQAQAQAACPDSFPITQVRAGMMGSGLTTPQGTAPQPFQARVIGVQPDAVAPGRDLIVVELDSAAITAAGGVWQGMSGSPVTLNGRLLGAVSWGFAFTPSPIVALTPGADMLALLELSPAEQQAYASAMPDEVVLTGALADEVRARLGSGYHDTTVALQQLPLPLTVSGLADRRLEQAREGFADLGVAGPVRSGASAAFSQAATDAPTPGGPFAAVLSYGDFTAAAFGTTTAVCDDRAVAFGHPFFTSGPSGMGASTADVLTVFADPNGPPFVIANVADRFGTLDQDRLAGVRSLVGETPHATALLSSVEDLDTGAAREGRSDIVYEPLLAGLAPDAMLASSDAVVDRYGPGTSEVTFTLTGSGEDTGMFTHSRTNRWVSEFDIVYESWWEFADILSALTQFAGEDVTIDTAEVEVAYRAAEMRWRLGEVRIGVDGSEPQPIAGVTQLQALPGSTLVVDADLLDVGSDEATTVSGELTIPDDVVGYGFLEILGGTNATDRTCSLLPEVCGLPSLESVEELFAALDAVPPTSTVVARLQLEAPVEGEAPVYEQEPPVTPPAVVATFETDRPVEGNTGVSILVGTPGGTVQRVAGDTRLETALQLADWFGPATTVVVAPADDYPYALVAAPLAARESAPVLLSDTTTLSGPVAAWLTAAGVTRVILVAPDGTFGAGVDSALAAAGVSTVERVGGADRYEVAANVARRLGGGSAWLVEGHDESPERGWPDALAVAPLAAREGRPILLTDTDGLPMPTAGVIEEMGISQITVAGGPAAVGPGALGALAATGAAVEVLAGANRYETSRLLADRAVAEGALRELTFLATGADWPDSIAAAPVVAAYGGTLLLVDGRDLTQSPAALDWIASLPIGSSVVLLGGVAAIDGFVEQQIYELIGGLVAAQP